MAGQRVLLVSGVCSYWGARLADQLARRPDCHVIGMDREPPPTPIRDLDFIQADPRNPLLGELLRSEGVEAVCHLAFEESPRPNEASFDSNVLGTMKMLSACVEAGVHQVVLKSSTMVYGARHDNSAFLSEDSPLHGCPHSGTVRDLVEIETCCNGFRSQIPQMALAVLRFPGILGPTADAAMTRFLSASWAPILLGFDPLLQLIHEEDVVAALAHVLQGGWSGAVNVAGEGLLPISQVLALAGKLPIPVLHSLAYWGRRLPDAYRAAECRDRMPIDPDYLRYSWVSDLSKMRDEVRFIPRYSAGEALRDFVAQQRLNRYLHGPAALASDAERLRETLDRRQRFDAKPQQGPDTLAGEARSDVQTPADTGEASSHAHR